MPGGCLCFQTIGSGAETTWLVSRQMLVVLKKALRSIVRILPGKAGTAHEPFLLVKAQEMESWFELKKNYAT